MKPAPPTTKPTRLQPAVRLAALAMALPVLGSALVSPVRAAGGDPSKAGAYCKIPEPGEKPECLAPAQAKYEDFFAAVDDPGSLDSDAIAGVEADLASNDEASVLALSSLAYGYWRLALQVAETEEIDPAVARQLNEWNELLASVYADSDADPELRRALQVAAADLEDRTRSDRFQPAAGLGERLSSAGEQLGVRGAIRRVLEALVGGEDGS